MQLKFIDYDLRVMLHETEKETGVELTDTSLYRIDDPGVHGQLPLRGIDVRMRDRLIGKAFEEHINARWTYDPSRPKLKCAKLHGEGANMHLHTQTHHNTVRIL